MPGSVQEGPHSGDKRKKPYQPPQLTVFGALSKLTQNGTGATSESNGAKLCGGNYQAKGSQSC